MNNLSRTHLFTTINKCTRLCDINCPPTNKVPVRLDADLSPAHPEKADPRGGGEASARDPRHGGGGQGEGAQDAQGGSGEGEQDGRQRQAEANSETQGDELD